MSTYEILDSANDSRSSKSQSPLDQMPDRNSRSRSRSRSPRRDSRRHRSRSPGPRNGSGRHHSPNPTESKCLGVFGLSRDTREIDIKKLFERYAPVEEVKLIIDPSTHQSRGFGFVYFSSIEDSSEALKNCNGIELHGRAIRVDYSHTQRAHTPTPGIYMGRPTTNNRGGGGRRFNDDYRRSNRRFSPFNSRRHDFDGGRSSGGFDRGSRGSRREYDDYGGRRSSPDFARRRDDGGHRSSGGYGDRFDTRRSSPPSYRRRQY
ncbi:hypothetical protein RDWZM_004873 [Blomia tropicalis]|uniref:RRM domain-containing protein n=1 Tax=Blomia tropicalis TaxID=40697 RepID=A0A9Q0M4J7_BLOTA|nr:transformer 2 beta [Blomia tropicalis]KAJ6219061.1 hypothetical protein RDWZM_004873 [Blomia tropicalis]